MGSPDGTGAEPEEPGRYSEETQHEVILTESFYMQTTEVTQKQWNDVVLAAESAGYLTVGELDEQPSGSPSGAYKEDYPVETVSWNNTITDGYTTGTKPVAKKQPNKWGLFDMQGNLYEWCSDRYGATYPTGPVTDPIGPLTGLNRVLRGGEWSSSSRSCRAAYRSYDLPDSLENYF